ncbi:MAG: ATP-binding cassette domain-containing protein [Candidatus Promineifilaceae bacterium]
MNSLTCDKVSKSFGPTHAVIDLSFEVQPGEIFSILGPNGAGKTTTIRMVLDILRPDDGKIEVFGKPINQAAKDRIGYLPEERGLYKNLTVIDCLSYLGRLKGMKAADARRRATELINRVELGEVIDKKVSQLSRGMQQKAQFAATIIHDPDLVIIDEPFSGLDPVNTLLIKEMIYEMKAAGKTIIMSTHMMHQVETMASRMLMLNKGQKVLYGPVDDVRRQYADHALYIGGAGNWASLPFAERVTFDEDERASLVMLRQGITPDDAFRMIAQQPNLHVDRFEVALPSLDDIFISVVEGRQHSHSNGTNGNGKEAMT